MTKEYDRHANLSAGTKSADRSDNRDHAERSWFVQHEESAPEAFEIGYEKSPEARKSTQDAYKP